MMQTAEREGVDGKSGEDKEGDEKTYEPA